MYMEIPTPVRFRWSVFGFTTDKQIKVSKVKWRLLKSEFFSRRQEGPSVCMLNSSNVSYQNISVRITPFRHKITTRDLQMCAIV